MTPCACWVVLDLAIHAVKGSIDFYRRNLYKIGKNNEICCENYDVDDDGGDGGCNHNGDDNNGLVQMHKLFSSKL